MDLYSSRRFRTSCLFYLRLLAIPDLQFSHLGENYPGTFWNPQCLAHIFRLTGTEYMMGELAFRGDQQYRVVVHSFLGRMFLSQVNPVAGEGDRSSFSGFHGRTCFPWTCYFRHNTPIVGSF